MRMRRASVGDVNNVDRKTLDAFLNDKTAAAEGAVILMGSDDEGDPVRGLDIIAAAQLQEHVDRAARQTPEDAVYPRNSDRPQREDEHQPVKYAHDGAEKAFRRLLTAPPAPWR